MAGARCIKAPTVIGTHEFAFADATGGKSCALMRASDIRGEEAPFGETRQDELRLEQSDAHHGAGGETRGVGYGLPGGAERLEDVVFVEDHRAEENPSKSDETCRGGPGNQAWQIGQLS